MAYVVFMPLVAYNAAMDYLIQTPNQLASHLRSLRRAHRMTQAQLGSLVGLDQTRIAKIEKDPRRISVAQLVQILSALGVRMVLQTVKTESEKQVTPNVADRADW
jgi:HTH-type transcriptional regulator / antitoxin HipB